MTPEAIRKSSSRDTVGTMETPKMDDHILFAGRMLREVAAQLSELNETLKLASGKSVFEQVFGK